MNVLVIVATALAAGVEWVEALTIVLAVGMFKGWRTALAGTALFGNVAVQPDQSCSMVRKRFTISGRISKELESANNVQPCSGAA